MPMQKRDNDIKIQKSARSKLRIAAKIFGIIWLIVSGILMCRLGYRLFFGSGENHASEVGFKDIINVIWPAIVGCGLYMLGSMKKLRTTSKWRYSLFAVYALILILIAIFYLFVTSFIGEWFQ